MVNKRPNNKIHKKIIAKRICRNHFQNNKVTKEMNSFPRRHTPRKAKFKTMSKMKSSS